MALWVKVQQLNSEVMRQLQMTIYGVHFPIEVRHFFASWIENQPWLVETTQRLSLTTIRNYWL
jgi:signal transducer and activator of transcription 5B